MLYSGIKKRTKYRFIATEQPEQDFMESCYTATIFFNDHFE